MQRLRINHCTGYAFPTPVTLLPHRLLIRPREGHDIRIVSSTLDINSDYQIKWHRDIFDNSVAVVSFSEQVQNLTITSEVTIDHYEEAPLDFLVADYAVSYPFSYLQEEEIDLQPYQTLAFAQDQEAVKHWIKERYYENGPIETFALVDLLSKSIHANFQYVTRYESGVQTPAQTLGQRQGSCRDFATLLMEACRCLGLASRFVSGYLHAPTSEAGNGSTHAWAEIYLPGPGWKGFDPTSGQVTGSQHIPVAVARHPEMVPPISGGFIGPAGSAPPPIVNVLVTPVA